MEFLKRIVFVSAIACLLCPGLVTLSGWGLSGAYVPSLTDGFPATLYLDKVGGARALAPTIGLSNTSESKLSVP